MHPYKELIENEKKKIINEVPVATTFLGITIVINLKNMAHHNLKGH